MCKTTSIQTIPKPIITTQTNFATMTVAGTSHPNQITRKEVVGYEEPPSGFRPKSVSMLSRVKSTITDRPSKMELSLREARTSAPSPSPQPSPKKAPPRPVAPSPSKVGLQWEKVCILVSFRRRKSV